MEQNKQIQVQFRLMDLQQLQFVSLANEWPEGDMQITNQIQFNSDTEKRIVNCTAHFEYKKNDITQLILAVQSTFEFAREGWSAMYQLKGDEWILPAGLVQHMAGLTIDSARGILAIRSEEANLPRLVLPILSPAQIIKNNLRFPRKPVSQIPSNGAQA